MPVGCSPFKLKRQHKRLIHDAATILVDEFHSDIRSLQEDGLFQDTFMAGFLPERYLHRYDLAFAKLFLDVTIVVNWKIQQKEWWCLNSVAEELAMWAVLGRAETIADMDGQSFEPRDLVDDIFEDFDFHWLFESDVDGTDNNVQLLEANRIENLRFADWFKPFQLKGAFHALR